MPQTIGAIRRYYNRHGCYPGRILADKIYRNRQTIAYCKARGIRLSGPSLGRLKKHEENNKVIEYQDNAERVKMERGFSLLNRRFGAGPIPTKRKDTTLSSISLSIIAMNPSKLTADFLRPFFRYIFIFNNFKSIFEN